MSAYVLARLALIPLVVWLASLAARRWGHALSGWLSGLPIIAGPLMLFITLDQGPAFAQSTALIILQTMPAVALHCLAFAWAARRFGWIVALLIALAAYVGVALLSSTFTLTLGAALTYAMAVVTISIVAMPRVRGDDQPAPIPTTEVAVRMVFAFVIAALVTLGATHFGPRLSGILMTIPIAGIVLPAFTRALHGPTQTVRLLAGFAQGLIGFALFFAVLIGALADQSVAVAFTLASLTALATSELVRRLSK